MRISHLFFIATLVVLHACSGNGIQQEEYDRLLKENENLKAEIEELKFGADRMLADAKNLLSSQKYHEASSELSMLIKKHPSSNEAIEGKELLEKAESEIEKMKALAEKEAKAAEDAEKRRLEQATSKMRKRVDEVEGITWYHDKHTTKYNNSNSLHLYIGKKENSSPWLRFRIQYKGSDWLFIQNYKIKTDRGTYAFTPSSDVERDNGSGTIWEWCDENIDRNSYDLIMEIIESKSPVKIRHIGNQYHNERTLTSREKRALQNVLDAYEALGGSLDFSL